MFNNFFPKIVPFTWDNVEKYGTARQATDDNIIWRMRFACWMTDATDTRSEYVTCLLLAVARQQWLRERASRLHLYVHRVSCLRTGTGPSCQDIRRVLWNPPSRLFPPDWYHSRPYSLYVQDVNYYCAVLLSLFSTNLIYKTPDGTFSYILHKRSKEEGMSELPAIDRV
jgi:hypothetical protein